MFVNGLRDAAASPGGSALLELGQANPLEAGAALAAPGGFAWWYCDLVDDRGSGLVLVWAFGLPFLPRADTAAPARERPSIAVALYRGGRVVHYALAELAPQAVHWQSGSPRFELGPNRIALDVADATATLHAELDLRVAGSRERLRGRIGARGPRLVFGTRRSAPAHAHSPCAATERHALADAGTKRAAAPSDAGAHRWTPIAAGVAGEAVFTFGASSFALEGRAYLDANASTRPLDALGIREWWWGRLALGARELVFYLVTPDEPGARGVRYLFAAEPDGTAVLDAEPLVTHVDTRRGRYGLRFPNRMRLSHAEGLDVWLDLLHLVDDGPFYQRFLVSGRCDDGAAEGRGVVERVVPPRVDRPWQRPFVAMRRQHARGRDSLWLPLFDGPAHGRVARLLRHWFARGAEQEVPQ